MVCVVVGALLKQIRPDFLPLARIGIAVAIGVMALSVITPLVTYINSLFSSTSLGEWGGSVLKALGIAIVVQIAADICRDCGESSAASGVELIGKLEILLLCLPIIKSILETVREVLIW